MKRVNDIFYSLQGEGRNAGRAALFVRFAGCNLKCPFCDTDFESYHEWSEDYIVTELLAHCIDHGVIDNQPLVVLTSFRKMQFILRGERFKRKQNEQRDIKLKH